MYKIHLVAYIHILDYIFSPDPPPPDPPPLTPHYLYIPLLLEIFLISSCLIIFYNFPLFLSYSLPFLHSFTSTLSFSHPPSLFLSSSHVFLHHSLQYEIHSALHVSADWTSCSTQVHHSNYDSVAQQRVLLSPHFVLRDPHLPTANRPVGESADNW